MADSTPADWYKVANDLVNNTAKQFGRGWSMLGHDLQVVLVRSRVLGVITSWNDKHSTLADARALSIAVQNIMEP